MKNVFSTSIDESLSGRPNPNTGIPSDASDRSTSTNQKVKQDKGLGKNIDGTFKQSNAGRHMMDKAQKKVQLTLTIKPTTKESLDIWAKTKSRSAANYISEYVEDHLSDIMDYFS